MAITTGTGAWISRRTHKQTWSAIPNGNQGSSFSAPTLPDKTVQVTGTLGVGGSVNIEGSNDGGTTWHILNDTRGEGNPLTLTALDTRKILENPQLIRPNVTAGDGTTALTVNIISTAQLR